MHRSCQAVVCNFWLSETEEEEGDTIPDRLEPGDGSIDKSLKTFVKLCVRSPFTNQHRTNAVEKYPFPNVSELRPPKLDMTMKTTRGQIS